MTKHRKQNTIVRYKGIDAIWNQAYFSIENIAQSLRAIKIQAVWVWNSAQNFTSSVTQAMFPNCLLLKFSHL